MQHNYLIDLFFTFFLLFQPSGYMVTIVTVTIFRLKLLVV